MLVSTSHKPEVVLALNPHQRRICGNKPQILCQGPLKLIQKPTCTSNPSKEPPSWRLFRDEQMLWWRCSAPRWPEAATAGPDNRNRKIKHLDPSTGWKRFTISFKITTYDWYHTCNSNNDCNNTFRFCFFLLCLHLFFNSS